MMEVYVTYTKPDGSSGAAIFPASEIEQQMENFCNRRIFATALYADTRDTRNPLGESVKRDGRWTWWSVLPEEIVDANS